MSMKGSDSLAGQARYATHLPVLCEALTRVYRDWIANGSFDRGGRRRAVIIEAGSGRNSTPVIQTWCNAFGWLHYAYESDPEWRAGYPVINVDWTNGPEGTVGCGYFSVPFVGDDGRPLISSEGPFPLADLLFVDCEIENRRAMLDWGLKWARYIVVHDWEEQRLYNYTGWPEVSATQLLTAKPTGLPVGSRSGAEIPMYYGAAKLIHDVVKPETVLYYTNADSLRHFD